MVAPLASTNSSSGGRWSVAGSSRSSLPSSTSRRISAATNVLAELWVGCRESAVSRGIAPGASRPGPVAVVGDDDRSGDADEGPRVDGDIEHDLQRSGGRRREGGLGEVGELAEGVPVRLGGWLSPLSSSNSSWQQRVVSSSMTGSLWWSHSPPLGWSWATR